MKIPKKLKIGGHWYKVIYKNREKEDGNSSFGTHYSKHCKIWIDSSSCKSQQEATLFHEIIEAINSNNELNLNHSILTTLENCLYQVFKDNKLLKD